MPACRMSLTSGGCCLCWLLLQGRAKASALVVFSTPAEAARAASAVIGEPLLVVPLASTVCAPCCSDVHAAILSAAGALHHHLATGCRVQVGVHVVDGAAQAAGGAGHVSGSSAAAHQTLLFEDAFCKPAGQGRTEPRAEGVGQPLMPMRALFPIGPAASNGASQASFARPSFVHVLAQGK